jgi:hypothetical protein
MSKTPEQKGINIIKSMCVKMFLNETVLSDNVETIKNLLFRLKTKMKTETLDKDTIIILTRILKNYTEESMVLMVKNFITRNIPDKDIEGLCQTSSMPYKNLAEVIQNSVYKYVKQKKNITDDLERIKNVKIIVDDIEDYIRATDSENIINDLVRVPG